MITSPGTPCEIGTETRPILPTASSAGPPKPKSVTSGSEVEGADRLHVSCDLGHELVLGLEDPLGANEVADLDADLLAVEVPVEVEQVRLDEPLPAAWYWGRRPTETAARCREPSLSSTTPA